MDSKKSKAFADGDFPEASSSGGVPEETKDRVHNAIWVVLNQTRLYGCQKWLVRMLCSKDRVNFFWGMSQGEFTLRHFTANGQSQRGRRNKESKQNGLGGQHYCQSLCPAEVLKESV